MSCLECHDYTKGYNEGSVDTLEKLKEEILEEKGKYDNADIVYGINIALYHINDFLIKLKVKGGVE